MAGRREVTSEASCDADHRGSDRAGETGGKSGAAAGVVGDVVSREKNSRGETKKWLARRSRVSIEG